MATTRQILKRALQKIGELEPGEAMEANQEQDALLDAKMIIDGWANETLLTEAYVHEAFTLDGSGSYTIGDGADFDTTRPTVLQHARIASDTLDSTVRIASLEEWANIDIKSTEKLDPLFLYYEPSYPTGTLYFSARPQSGDTLKLISAKPIAQLPALTAEMEYPPGYDRLIRLGLEVELSREYGKQVDQYALREFERLKAQIKSVNSANHLHTMSLDSALKPARRFDIETGPG